MNPATTSSPASGCPLDEVPSLRARSGGDETSNRRGDDRSLHRSRIPEGASPERSEVSASSLAEYAERIATRADSTLTLGVRTTGGQSPEGRRAGVPQTRSHCPRPARGRPGRLGAAEAREDMAVFGHGHLLRVLAARWLDLRPAEGRLFLLSTTTVSVLAPGAPEVRRPSLERGLSSALTSRRTGI